MPEINPIQQMLLSESRGSTADYRELQQTLDRSRRLATQTPVFRSEFARRHRPRLSTLKDSEVAAILQYLQNPVRTGLWTLRVDWKDFAGVSEFVWHSIENRFTAGDEIDIHTGKVARRFKLTEEHRKQFYQRICGRLSFVFELFTHLVRLDSPPVEHREVTEDIDPQREVDEVILHIVDLQAVKTQFKHAYEFFRQNLYHDDFEPSLSGLTISRPKGGFFLLPYGGPSDCQTFALVSFEPTVLEHLRDFLRKVDKVSDAGLSRVFSPEEELFAPYFAFLRLTFPHISRSDRLAPQFQKAFTDYENGDFVNCVETLGLVAEDYLVQIHETLFRESCPKRLTLAQVYARIHAVLRQRFQPAAPGTPEINQLSRRVEDLSQRATPAPTADTMKESLQLLREVVGIVKQTQPSESNPLPQSLTIFRLNVAENIEELIRYHHAASDKSRIPVDSHEAVRTMFCLITTILWWEDELLKINWKESGDAILRDVIQRNTGVIV